jgi:cell division protein FtsW (lipid II flippase)
MNTAEIILLIVLFIFITYPLFYLEIKVKDKYKTGMGMMGIVTTILIFFIFILNSIELNKLRKSLDCPEYEKSKNCKDL